MAKRFVQVSLATKLRVLFGFAVLASIAAALAVPFWYTELLSQEDVQSSAAAVTRLRLNEWQSKHTTDPDHDSEVALLYTESGRLEGRRGPKFVRLAEDMTADPPLSWSGRQALKAFLRNVRQDMAIIDTEDDSGARVFRCFRAVRVEETCQQCHGQSVPVDFQFQPGQLVGIIDVTVPGAEAGRSREEAGGWAVWQVRGAFAFGGALAALVSIVVFALIAQKLVLTPVRLLREVADKVAEGDMSVRNDISTGDELERLGDSVNEMLAAITNQHAQLRQANRALDLKLGELAESNVALYQANQVKTEFLANISHELRTPLNSVIGFADLLCEWGDEKVRRYGHNISSSAKRLLGMINDLLDLAKIEAGKADVRPAQVSVIDICDTLLALMDPVATKKQIELRGEVSADLPMIRTDPGKLQQILYNLLSNAVKYTPAGGKVTLAARAETPSNGHAAERRVAITVSDTGPGIAEADQVRIFDKFYQADSTLTREAAGTGLGLAIAKELAQLLGAQLTLKSTPGHGADFTVTLPLDLPQGKPAKEARTAAPE
jgi:signal transduction histidine kinase